VHPAHLGNVIAIRQAGNALPRRLRYPYQWRQSLYGSRAFAIKHDSVS